MGEMTVKGYAKREIKCDLVKYIFNFEATGYSIAESVEAVNDELEHFLSIIEKNIKITPEVFKIENNSTSKSYNSNNDNPPYKANRKISVLLPMKTGLSDLFMKLISKYEFNVELSENYDVSNIEEIHKELLKSAIEDSKNKAEMLASFAGEKIAGIKTLKTFNNKFHSNDEDEGYMLDDIFKIIESKSSLLSSPTVEESESVEIVWLLE